MYNPRLEDEQQIEDIRFVKNGMCDCGSITCGENQLDRNTVIASLSDAPDEIIGNAVVGVGIGKVGDTVRVSGVVCIYFHTGSRPQRDLIDAESIDTI